jgi:hypothetical protein
MLFAPFARQAYLADILTGGLIDLNRTGVVYSIASSALPPSSPNVEAELAPVEDAGSTVAALESEVRDERPREPSCAWMSAALQKQTLTG